MNTVMREQDGRAIDPEVYRQDMVDTLEDLIEQIRDGQVHTLVAATAGPENSVTEYRIFHLADEDGPAEAVDLAVRLAEKVQEVACP